MTQRQFSVIKFSSFIFIPPEGVHSHTLSTAYGWGLSPQAFTELFPLTDTLFELEFLL